MKEKLKKTTIYLLESQDIKLKELANGKRGKVTRLIRRGINMIIKKEGGKSE